MHRRENPRLEFATKETNKRRKEVPFLHKEAETRQLAVLGPVLVQIAEIFFFVTEISLWHCSPSHPMYHAGPAAGRPILPP